MSGVNDHIGSGLSAKTTPKFSAMIGDSNSSGTFGWLASVLYDKRDHVEQSVDAQGWMTGLDYTQFDPAYTNVAMPQTLQYTVTHTSSTRKAVNGAIDWSPTDNLKVTFDTMLSRYDVTSKYDAFGQYSNTDNVQSISADPNGTILKYTQFNTGLMANDYIEGSTPRKETNEQTGAHVTYRINDSTEVDWDIADSKAWNKGAANGYIAVIGTRNVGVNPVFTNNGSSLLPSYSNILPTTDMSNLHAHVQQYGADNPDVSNKILENRIHLSKTFLSGVLTQLDFGVEATSQSKKQVGYITPNTFGCLEYCGYTANIPADAVGAHVINVGSLVSGVSPGSPTQWIAYDANKLFAYLASPAAYNQRPDPAAFAATLAANGGGFAARPDLSTYSKVREQIESAYAKANLQGSLGDMPWTLDLGMRYTKTITRPSAYSVPVLSIYVNPNDTSNAIPTYGTETAISDKGSYSNWLPSASFKLNLRDNLIFRLALSKTLTRPDLSSLADSVSYNFLPNSQEINMGNPNLKPYTSKNVDAGLEWYFNDTSYVALDGFYKDVGNFITTITTGETFLGFPFQVTRPVNLNSAKVKGAEFTFNYQISDMNGFLSAFNGFGVATNYTYVTSSASISPAEIASGALFAIPGIGNSANVSGYYDKGPIELRLAYNWRASYLETLADDEGNPLSVKAYGQLDFSSSYRINRHVSLFLDMTNLTNETINKYEVYLNRQDYAEANGRTMYFGVRASL
jgi:TonB-dependent receptor